MENAGKTKENGGCTMTHAGWTTKNADFTIKTLSTLIEWSSPWRTCWYVFGHVQCASIFVVHCTWYRWAPLEEQIGENTCNNHGYWHSEVDSIIQYIYIYVIGCFSNKQSWVGSRCGVEFAVGTLLDSNYDVSGKHFWQCMCSSTPACLDGENPVFLQEGLPSMA